MPGLTKGTGLTLISSDTPPVTGTVMVTEAASDSMLTETGDTMISET